MEVKTKARWSLGIFLVFTARNLEDRGYSRLIYSPMFALYTIPTFGIQFICETDSTWIWTELSYKTSSAITCNLLILSVFPTIYSCVRFAYLPCLGDNISFGEPERLQPTHRPFIFFFFEQDINCCSEPIPWPELNISSRQAKVCHDIMWKCPKQKSGGVVLW